MSFQFFIHETPTPLTEARMKAVVGGLPNVSEWAWDASRRVLTVHYDETRVSPTTLQFILTRAGLPALAFAISRRTRRSGQRP